MLVFISFATFALIIMHVNVNINVSPFYNHLGIPLPIPVLEEDNSVALSHWSLSRRLAPGQMQRYSIIFENGYL